MIDEQEFLNHILTFVAGALLGLIVAWMLLLACTCGGC